MTLRIHGDHLAKIKQCTKAVLLAAIQHYEVVILLVISLTAHYGIYISATKFILLVDTIHEESSHAIIRNAGLLSYIFLALTSIVILFIIVKILFSISTGCLLSIKSISIITYNIVRGTYALTSCLIIINLVLSISLKCSGNICYPMIINGQAPANKFSSIEISFFYYQFESIKIPSMIVPLFLYFSCLTVIAIGYAISSRTGQRKGMILSFFNFLRKQDSKKVSSDTLISS